MKGERERGRRGGSESGEQRVEGGGFDASTGLEGDTRYNMEQGGGEQNMHTTPSLCFS